MTLARARMLALVGGLVGTALARAGETMPGEVRVLSAPRAPTVVTLQAVPEATIEDRTVGAHPAAGDKGPASMGETFSDEVTFVIRGATVARQASIDVEDALVSTVRLFPDPAGTQVVIFVRQPVSYAIGRPTATGALAVTLRPRATVVATPSGGAGRRPAKPKDEDKDEVAVDAAELQYDQQANVLIARGGVTLTRGAMTLRADEVRYDRTAAVAEAHGHVVLVDPEATVEGDSARIDLNDETGWIDDVEADMKQSPYRLRAGHVEKRGGPCYGIKDGVFTTCRCGGLEKPSWSIAGADTDIDLQGVGVTKHATFRVQDVPVAYFPYLLFPANTERQSGFLFPRVGYSNQRGFTYEQPFYWAIDKSSDATIAIDVETAARIGAIGDYRYTWSKQTKGLVTWGYFNESIGGNPEPIQPLAPGTLDVPVNRWIVASRHTQPFVLPESQLYMDVLRVSDDQFLREIRAFASTVREDIQIRSTRVTRSKLGTVKTWEGGGMQFEGVAYQDLIDPQELALNRVPRLAAEHSMPLWGGRVVPRLAGQADYFERTDAFDGFRFDLGPEVTVPFNAGRYLFGSVRGQVRETAYHLTDTEQMAIVIPNSESISPTFRAAPELPRLDANHTREIGRVDGRLATEVSRVFEFPHFGYEKLRHSIEPEMQYLFVPQVHRELFQQALGPCRVNPNNPSRLARGEQPGVNCEATLFSEGYLFDEIDAIDRRNFFSYGITTRLFGRGATTEEVAERAAVVAFDAADTGALDVRAEAAEEDDDDEDEDGDGTPFDAIDADTYPQGLPAVLADRPAARPRPAAPTKSTAKTPATKTAVIPGSAELLRASVLQGYDFSRDVSGSSHFSDVDLSIRLTPISYFGLSYLTSVDLNEGRTLAQTVGAFVREPWWQPPAGRVSFQVPSSIAVAYRFIADNLNSGLTPGTAEERLLRNNAVEGIDGSAYLRLGDYLGFLFLARYDLSTTLAPDPDRPLQLRRLGPHFLERDYILRVMSRCDCWLLEAGVSDRFDTDETTFRVQFTLYGLGSFGQGRARTGYTSVPGLQNIGFKRPWTSGGSE